MESHGEPARPRRRLRYAIFSREVIAALIVGALTVASTIAGAVATNWLEVRQTITEKSSRELSDDVATLQRQLAESLADAAALRDQVASLEEENAWLKGAPSSSDAPSSRPAAGVYRQSDDVAIAPDYCLDLDSEEKDWDLLYDWGSELPVDARDLCYRFDALELLAMTLVDAEPTKDECESRTLIEDSLPELDFRHGQWVCGVTDEGRITSIYVESVDGNPTMRIRVWSEGGA